MGVSLYLGPFGANWDNGFEGPSWNIANRRFFEEIIIPSDDQEYFRHDEFLNQEEQSALTPEYEDSKHPSRRSLDALMLAGVFERVLHHLRENSHRYPKVHAVVEVTHANGNTADFFFEFKGRLCMLKRDHENIEHNDELLVSCWNNGWEDLEWIKVEPIVIIGELSFHIATRTKLDEYGYILEELIDTCKHLHEAGMQATWSFA